jgi:electron transfer flavoprotein alpha subunit
MSVLVYIDIAEGKIKKPSFEAAGYGAKIGGGSATAIAFGSIDSSELEKLGEYGINKVLHVASDAFNHFDPGAYTKAIAKAAQDNGVNTVVLSFNQNGKALGPRLAVRLEAGYIPGATSMPADDGTYIKSVFSGKALAHYKSNSDKTVIALGLNSVSPEKTGGSASVESYDPGLSDSDFVIKVKEVDKVKGQVPLTEAEIVVSAGRGLKGPENWGIIEDLAKELNAATACSRPVADVGWRPHHEHVGQTGVTVKPNLYFAIGISGAIQHLAGVNSSKVIVVINNDPEAPFFKAADYGVVGDAFDVVPRLTEELKKFHAANS